VSELSKASILAAISTSRRPPTVQGICALIGYHTRTPWGVVFLVQEMEQAGWVTWHRKRGTQSRVEITDAGRAALAEVERIAVVAGKERAG
jgi:DNA-binding MarR family transcriptional regulator